MKSIKKKQNSEITDPSILVVLSIPFQRLIRSHLSSFVLDSLSSTSDVAIVSPFADNALFANRYSDPDIHHVLAPSKTNLPKLSRIFVDISTILRMRGYWFRYRKYMPYFWESRHVRLLEDGSDYKLSLPYRIAIDLLAIIGYFPFSWRLFDYLHAFSSYKFRDLFLLADRYDQVILVQASSWGFQDAVLGHLGRIHNWRTVMVPYTTDQLFCNGYLYSNFDKVCVQGSLEERRASALHKISPNRVERLGSAYARVLNSIIQSNNSRCLKSSLPNKSILYAGVSSKYFPEECEIEAVKSLSTYIETCFGKDWKLIYRPVNFSKNAFEILSSKLHEYSNVEIDPPSASLLGLNNYTDASSLDEVSGLVNRLMHVDLLICSRCTSMAIDAAFCGTPTISYLPLYNKILQRRRYDLQLDKNGRFYSLPSIPVAFNLAELIDLMSSLMTDSEKCLEITANIVKNWDFPDFDFKDILISAIYANT